MTPRLKVLDRRSRLRSATSLAHARLDHRITEDGFFDDQKSYASYLQATWRARWPIEQALEDWGASTVFSLWPYRVLALDLQADLDDLGMRASVDMDPMSTVEISNASQALGVLYVLEGSALGARLLAQRAKAIGMTSHMGARHLARQTGTPGAWPAFRRALEGAQLDANEESDCVAAAIATFDQFELEYSRRQ